MTRIPIHDSTDHPEKGRLSPMRHRVLEILQQGRGLRVLVVGGQQGGSVKKRGFFSVLGDGVVSR